jgi:hypothetical protein
MESSQSGRLVEVDQSVKNGNDVVDAKDERIEDTGATELDPAVHIVELRQGEGYHCNEDDPRLPPIELV